MTSASEMPSASGVGIVIQARMGSTRLPGKVLTSIAGVPLLGRLLRRLANCSSRPQLIVATSDLRTDDCIAEFAASCGAACFRGSEHDVLLRYYDAALAFGLSTVVRVTADNPLTDPWGIDALVNLSEGRPGTYIHNVHAGGYPYGTGAELIPFGLLEQSVDSACTHEEREHVTTVLRRQPEKFPQFAAAAPSDLRGVPYCFSVDYPEDLLFVDAIYTRHGGRDDVKLSDIVRELRERPSLVLNQTAPIRTARPSKSR